MLPVIIYQTRSRWTRTLLVAGLGTALAFALPATAQAKGHPHGSTTTTTKPAGSTQSKAVAKLVIKANSIGHVSVEPAGTTTFTPATNGESLHVGDTVQTDSVGLAEIDYASDSYTRLDVSTTFTITKLTDSQGNRQVNGTLQTGETWNRTVALTQSESFQQQGGGTTAAVAGTAFVVDCTSPTQCTFTGVIDNVTLTGSGGQTQTLNPLSQCVSTSGTLCTAPSQLTPDQLALIQWIQTNVFLDYIEHGLGNGIFQPFSGTATVTNGVVQSFTPSTPNQGFTPTTPNSPPPPPPTPQPMVDQTDPVCQPVGVGCTPEAGNLTTAGDDTITADSLSFQLSGGSDNGLSFSYQFTALNTSHGRFMDTTDSTTVDMVTLYKPSTAFQYTPVGDPDTDPVDSFTYQAVDNNTPTAVSPTKATVQITVHNPGTGEPD
jgi:hypothetical protein